MHLCLAAPLLPSYIVAHTSLLPGFVGYDTGAFLQEQKGHEIEGLLPKIGGVGS